MPIGNVAPLAGTQLAATAPSTSSTADARYANDAPRELVASIVAGPGTPTTGAVVSGRAKATANGLNDVVRAQTRRVGKSGAG